MKYLLSATSMTVTIGVPAPQWGFRSNACKSLIICEKTEAYWRPDGAAPAVGTNRDWLFFAGTYHCCRKGGSADQVASETSASRARSAPWPFSNLSRRRHSATASRVEREPVTRNARVIPAEQAFVWRGHQFPSLGSRCLTGLPGGGIHPTRSVKLSFLNRGFLNPSGWMEVPLPTTPGQPLQMATMSDPRNDSRRSRPIRSFRVTSATTPRAGMRSTHADVRCRRSVSPLRRRPRSAAHDGAILARARCEPRQLPICLRLPVFTDRPFDRTWRSALASTSECPPRGCP